MSDLMKCKTGGCGYPADDMGDGYCDECQDALRRLPPHFADTVLVYRREGGFKPITGTEYPERELKRGNDE